MQAEQPGQHDQHDQHHDLVSWERRETGMGPANRPMWTAGMSWAIGWGVVGALLLFAMAWIAGFGLPLALRLVSYPVIGFLAGSAAGFIYGAGRQRDVDPEAREDSRFAPFEREP